MGASFAATGASQTRGKRIGDREKTAARLLRSSVERVYDAEVDIDWDEPWAEGKTFGPTHRLSLYGTRIWDKLSPEQRVELSRHELASIFSFGLFAECMLSSGLFRQILAHGYATDTTRYALAEIGDETRHSTMFSRAINKLGVAPYQLPSAMTRIAGVGLYLIPLGPSMHGGTLLIEEILDRLQREATIDENVQPHLRQLFKIHVLEEARHITFAREELVRSYQACGRAARAFHRFILATMAWGVYPTLVNPLVYRNVLGMSPLRGMLASLLNPRYAENAKFAAEPMVRFFHEVGMVEGRFTTRVWRAARMLPDDLHEEIFGEPPTTKTSWFKRVLGRAVGV
nr:diiron oxygenase [Segniliparus rugosus]